MTLLSFDPGLVALGWAVYRWPERRPATLDGYADLLEGSGTLTTRATGALASRLCLLHDSVCALVVRCGPSLVVVEAPAIEGQYGRHAARGGHRLNALAMRRNAQATGAVLAGAAHAGAEVQEVRALTSRGGKAESQRTMRLAFGKQLPKGSEHMRDALALGLRVLASMTPPRLVLTVARPTKEREHGRHG